MDKLALSDERIALALSPYGIELSLDQSSKVQEYIRILLKWNRLIGLTTIREPVEIVARHFGESMFFASIVPVENCRLADVGSGAGFPGLALKILSPSLQVILIESNKKKSAFLAEVARCLNLKGVEIITARYEEVRNDFGSVNIVTARAVGGFSSLLRWTKRMLAPRGHIALWVGGEDAATVSKIQGWIWQPAVRIPESQRRFILVGRPLP